MKASERIINALPKRRDHRACALEVLIRLAKGEAVHCWYGWVNFRKLSPAAGVSSAVDALWIAGVKYERGNDAPRGGALGEYVKLTRKMPSAISSFELALAACRSDSGK